METSTSKPIVEVAIEIVKTVVTGHAWSWELPLQNVQKELLTSYLELRTQNEEAKSSSPEHSGVVFAPRGDLRLEDCVVAVAAFNAKNDPDPSIFLTTTSIITILLPILGHAAVKVLKQCLAILLKGVYISSLLIALSSASSEPHPILSAVSVSSLKRCVTEFYNRVYGMYPCNTVRFVQGYMDAKRQSYGATDDVLPPAFELADDTVSSIREATRELDDFDENSMASEMLQDIAQLHRLHPHFVSSNHESETAQPWFSGKEAHDIALFCHSLEIDPSKSLRTSSIATESARSDVISASSADDGKIDTQALVKMIMDINRQLRQSIAELAVDQPASNVLAEKEASTADLNLLLIVNELNFELCMRQYYIQHISKLKKDIMGEEVRQADFQGVYAKLKFQTQELALAHQTLEQHRHESSMTRERQRKLEEDLTKRLRTTREQAKSLRDQLDTWEGIANERERDVKEMRAELSRKEQIIDNLESELELTSRDVERLRECEVQLEALTNRFMSGEIPDTETLIEERTNFASQLLSVEMERDDALRELLDLKQHFESQSTASDIAIARAEELEQTVERLENELEIIVSILQLCRGVNIERENSFLV
ncbi:hypothetical protein HDV00_003543 [Rhizophlyctis rosea]|nr:hypothetical protein HDV00_003543 [Rhizophlyctis rosea]